MNKLNTYWCHKCKKEFQDYFEEDDVPIWATCNGVFIELITAENEEEDHPKDFVPYVPENNESTEQPQNGLNSNPQRNGNSFSFNFTPGSGAQAIHIIHSHMNGPSENNNGMVGNLINMLNNMVHGGGEEIYENGMTFEQILQRIVQDDPNSYGPPPASEEAVMKLPKGTYSELCPKEEGKKDENNSEFNNCSICCDEYSYEDSTILNKLPCQHIYHEECIKTWLKSHNTWPACRFELPTNDIDYENNKLNSQNPNYMSNLLREARSANSSSQNNNPNDRSNNNGGGGSRPSYHF